MPKRLTAKSIKILEHLEKNYQLIFTIIMSAPLILAMEIILLKQNLKTGMMQFKAVSDFSIYDLLLFLVYLLVYVRFFLGDMRYLDLKYLEAQNEPSYLERYSPASRFIDFFSLLLHAICFYALAAAITNFRYFFYIMALIMVLNAVWLSLIYLTSDQINRQRTEHKSSLKWAINNAIAFILLILIARYGGFGPRTLSLFVVVMAVNSIADFSLAWRMYFPKIKDEIVD